MTNKLRKINAEKLRKTLEDLDLSNEDFYEVFLELFEDRVKDISKENFKTLRDAARSKDRSKDILRIQEFIKPRKHGDRLAIELAISMDEVRYCDFSKEKIKKFLMDNLGKLAIHRLIEAINDKIELKP